MSLCALGILKYLVGRQVTPVTRVTDRSETGQVCYDTGQFGSQQITTDQVNPSLQRGVCEPQLPLAVPLLAAAHTDNNW